MQRTSREYSYFVRGQEPDDDDEAEDENNSDEKDDDGGEGYSE